MKFFQNYIVSLVAKFFLYSYLVIPFLTLLPTLFVCVWIRPCDLYPNGCSAFSMMNVKIFYCGNNIFGHAIEYYFKIFGVFPRFFFEEIIRSHRGFPDHELYGNIDVSFLTIEAVVSVFSLMWLLFWMRARRLAKKTLAVESQ